jgi:cytochrome P450
MIEAGSETTSSALNSAIKFLAADPNVQKLARAELLGVVGEDRSPTFEDQNDLPYIRAMVKEILRMRPPTNIGTPHRATTDVIYKDMFISKGSIISIFQYALHFDPSRYEEPERFNPSRYLGYDLKAGAYAAHPDPYARDHFSFGAGRRICPGMHLAENSLFIVLAKMLWAFDIRPPLKDDGTEAKMDLSDEANEPGVNTLPKPYKARFIARSERAAEVVRKEWSQAEKDGFYLGSIKVDTAGMVVS